jgi:hypothetical protein
VTQPVNRSQNGLQDICAYIPQSMVTANDQVLAYFTNDTQTSQPLLVMEASLTKDMIEGNADGYAYDEENYWNLILTDEAGNQAILPLIDPADGLIHFSNDGLTKAIGFVGTVVSNNEAEHGGLTSFMAETFEVTQPMQITGFLMPTQINVKDDPTMAGHGLGGGEVVPTGSGEWVQLFEGDLYINTSEGGGPFGESTVAFSGTPVKDTLGNVVALAAGTPKPIISPWDGFSGGFVEWGGPGNTVNQWPAYLPSPVNLVPGVQYWLTQEPLDSSQFILQAEPSGPPTGGLSVWIPAPELNIITSFGSLDGDVVMPPEDGSDLIGPIGGSFAYTTSGLDSGSFFFELGGALIASPGIVNLSGRLTLSVAATGSPADPDGDTTGSTLAFQANTNFRALIGVSDPGLDGGLADGGTSNAGNIGGAHSGATVNFEQTGGS